MVYKAYIYKKQNQGDERSVKEFKTREELVAYLESEAEDADHVGDTILTDGGWTTIRVDGSVLFDYLNPEDHGWVRVDDAS